MKKILLVFTCLFVAKNTNAQSWNLTLNAISGNPNFGTSSNHPINFFTNGTQRMTLSTTGALRINNLAGTGSRFLQADANGNIVAWTGSVGNKDYLLYGDGVWKLPPVMGEAGNLFTAANSKLGIGIAIPAVALDVSGDVAATGAVKAAGGFKFNTTDGIVYNTTDNFFVLGKLGAPSPSPDPCLTLPAPTSLGWVVASNSGFVTTQAPAASLVNATLRMFVLPTNGSGYIELGGKDNTNASNNELFLNYHCSRNTNINTGANGGTVNIATGSPAAKLVAGDFVSMKKHLEIGDPSTGIINSSGNSALDININSGTGLRFRTTTAALPLIRIEKSTAPVFNVYSDGLTEINTDNLDALVVKDANLSNNTVFKLHSYGTAEFSSSSDAIVVTQTSGGPANFKLHSNGNAEFSTAATNALTVKNGNAGSTTFNVRSNGFAEVTTAAAKAIAVYDANNSNLETFDINSNGYTEIKTTNTKAFSIYNRNDGNKETFEIDANGYAQINVYSPTGMPIPSFPNSTPTITHNRVLTIRDASIGNRDLFVVRADGTVFAREIEINSGQNFPDYVFSDSYNLTSISELEKFINVNKHLPGFEKAGYYEKNGIAVNALLIKQQEKLEELVLYIIQLEKRLTSIEASK